MEDQMEKYKEKEDSISRKHKKISQITNIKTCNSDILLKCSNMEGNEKKKVSKKHKRCVPILCNNINKYSNSSDDNYHEQQSEGSP
jgi:hypothetical protein